MRTLALWPRDHFPIGDIIRIWQISQSSVAVSYENLDVEYYRFDYQFYKRIQLRNFLVVRAKSTPIALFILQLQLVKKKKKKKKKRSGYWSGNRTRIPVAIGSTIGHVQAQITNTNHIHVFTARCVAICRSKKLGC